ncbi:TetR/AcrR family transcriptional regulator [Paenibacillus anaericanus]|uniref:TetR/AcrR family transcriptional regulator n=1 Tax=Paenibacillus anaericanus TaxID=170367 RepID=A0A3S1E8M1_9BACL|nr:TetR/AcrR family transcriptional regulator [Paenibacillus anaericanus]RUT40315.1 TetR/AcrR family transcriptional regulator [Paenibacillus anaericanus]
MDLNEDKRIVRTRKILRGVFLELIMEKGLDYVTVKELTERAGLNRGTFYLHYKDIDDFYEQYSVDILEGYRKVIKKLGLSRNTQGPFIEPPYGYIKPFEYVIEHGEFFKCFMGPNGDPSFSVKLRELIREQLHHSFQSRRGQMIEVSVKQQYVFSYISSAYVGTLEFWISQGMNISSKNISILFTEISQLGSSNLDF